MKKNLIKIISSVLLFFSTISYATTDILTKTEEVAKAEVVTKTDGLIKTDELKKDEIKTEIVTKTDEVKKNEDATVALLNKENVQKVVILGGGVGALTSGIYLSRAGYTPTIIEGKTPGGLITQSHLVENWPGETQITGAALAEKLKSQALKNGCKILSKEVVDVDFSKKPYVITVKDLYQNDQVDKILADSCIIAMGTSSNHLNVEGEKEYWGKGVSNCALCDGSFYKNKDIAIVGGGDAAIVEANYLSNIANKVNVFVRKDSFKASDKTKVDAMNQKSNVKVFYHTEVVSINGDKENVKALTLLDNQKKENFNLDVQGVFLAIGSKPNTEIFKTKLDLDERGYIKINNNLQTSAKDVYAIGDIVDPVFKQAITAAGDGAKAAILCLKALELNQIDNKNKEILSEKTQVTENKVENKENVEPNTAQKEIEKPKVDLNVENPFGISIKEEPKKEPIDQLSLSNVIEIKDLNHFDSEMATKDVPIIIDFYATWCGPCKRISPILENQAKVLQGKVKILKVNVEKLQELALKYQIRAMPTIIVFDKDSKVLFKKMGSDDITSLLFSLEQIKDKSIADIESYLQNVK